MLGGGGIKEVEGEAALRGGLRRATRGEGGKHLFFKIRGREWSRAGGGGEGGELHTGASYGGKY